MEQVKLEKSNDVKRLINLKGSFNFRDLGGYPTEDGQHVKWGMLFRSGNLSRMLETDLEVVNELGIKKICDLRAADEIERFPDPVIEGAAWSHTPIISDEITVRQVGDLQDSKRRLENSKPGEMLLTLNRDMVTYAGPIKKVFDVLLNEPHTPLLFHCMAGKDRTGVIAALILSVLGVSREIILEDYLYTNRSLELMKAHFDEIEPNKNQHIDQEVLDALVEARAEYINAFFEEIENNFNSVETYVKGSIGLTDDDIKMLKDHLLEE